MKGEKYGKKGEGEIGRIDGIGMLLFICLSSFLCGFLLVGEEEGEEQEQEVYT